MASNKVTNEVMFLLPKGSYTDKPTAQHITDPTHGGKVTCRVCNGFIDTSQRYIKRGDTYEHLDSQGPACNKYANYYGPGVPID